VSYQEIPENNTVRHILTMNTLVEIVAIIMVENMVLSVSFVGAVQTKQLRKLNYECERINNKNK
jgi:hypothetical protein